MGEKPSARTDLFDSLEEAYRELQELRERVRRAEEEVAKRRKPRGGSRANKNSD